MKRLLTAAALCLALATGAGSIGASAAAWTEQTANPATGVAAGTLATPGSPTASTAVVSCNPVTVSWTSSGAPVDDYAVEKRVDGGSWTTVTASAGNVTSVQDATGYTNQTVQYRITALLAGTSWASSAVTTNTLSCGVQDLAVTNPCSSSVLTWSAAAAATTYDIEASTNAGGSWSTVATDQAGTSYTDNTQYANGASVMYRIRPGIGAGGNGSWSNTPTQANWQNFRVLSVSVVDTSTAGTIAIGDYVDVVFSKPPAQGSFTNTGVRVVRTGGGNSQLILGWNGSAGTLGSITGLGSNKFGATANYTGNGTWPAATTYRFTFTSAGTSMTADISAGSWSTSGSTATCAADASTLKTATAPTLGGQW